MWVGGGVGRGWPGPQTRLHPPPPKRSLITHHDLSSLQFLASCRRLDQLQYAVHIQITPTLLQWKCCPPPPPRNGALD